MTASCCVRGKISSTRRKNSSTAKGVIKTLQPSATSFGAAEVSTG